MSLTDPLAEFLSGFFHYSFHMNEAVGSLIKQNPGIPEKVLLLYSHTLNAQHIWNSRINGVKADRGVWEIVIPAEMSDLNRENHEGTMKILANSGLDLKIGYANTRGEGFENSVRDILLHVANHSTYHRGQIASFLKQAGIEPPVTDYIFYKRLKLE